MSARLPWLTLAVFGAAGALSWLVLDSHPESTRTRIEILDAAPWGGGLDLRRNGESLGPPSEASIARLAATIGQVVEAEIVVGAEVDFLHLERVIEVLRGSRARYLGCLPIALQDGSARWEAPEVPWGITCCLANDPLRVKIRPDDLLQIGRWPEVDLEGGRRIAALARSACGSGAILHPAAGARCGPLLRTANELAAIGFLYIGLRRPEPPEDPPSEENWEEEK